MERAISWWQHIPVSLEPVALTVGGLPIYWYALFFLFGAGWVYYLAGEQYQRLQIFTKSQYQDFAFGVFLSALVGGKLGFLLFYWWPFVARQDHWLPLAKNGGLGLPGMSFAGGLLGVVLFILWYTKRHQKDLFTVTDILALWIPLALFSGRAGSFIHGELPGRVTERVWGMYFSGESVLRHPSTLYAAFLEGFVLFSVLFFLKKQNVFREEGRATALFCIGYGILRFMSECFREPDVQIGYLGIFTFNQLMALGIVALGVAIFTVQKRKNNVY